MVGLPAETQEDIEGIIRLIKKVEMMGREKVGKKFSLNISINALIPKPHTPFQWVAQETEEELNKKFRYIIQKIRSNSISLSFSDTKLALLEAVFSRGDRRLGDVLEEAFHRGCKFDSWREHFNFKNWQESFQKFGLDMAFYAHRERGKDEIMPWDLIDCGVSKQYLWSEWEKAIQEANTDDCRQSICNSCGLEDICQEIGINRNNS